MTATPDGHLTAGDRLVRIETKIDQITAAVSTLPALEQRVTRLEEWQKWAVRTILTLVIGGAVTVILAAAGQG